jgi:LysR family transcriptional activator of glutamate synthase operon
MELRQLRYLVALAEERHFTRAAERMHVAQPALSQQIRRLEGELGLVLVHRTTRHVELTDAGELLVARARRALGELDAAVAELADLAGVRSGRVVVGAMQSLGSYDFSGLLAEFHARHPAVELTVREDVSDELLERLRGDMLDLAFLSLRAGAEPEGLETRVLRREPLVALLAPGDPRARRPRLRLADLRDDPFITFRRGAGIRRLVEGAAREAGFEPQIAFETDEVPRARALASRGLGVTIVPRHDGEVPGAPVAVVALHRPSLRLDVTLVWSARRRRTPAARAFLELALA